jgi:putative restriction endonuclease
MFECGLSETKVLPALDAAHVRPYSSGGTHSINNGILLRRDIHSVLDSGYATFDNNYQFVVSDRVRTDFNNGNEYRRLHGSQLKLPANKMLWPSQSNLEWHRNECFKE